MSTLAKIVDQNLPNVVLVGRVNVGKSTLFNRIAETNQAIVSDIPGTTRTRNIKVVNWRGKNFTLVDTGGLTFDEDVPLEKEIIIQTEKALDTADVIVFVTDLQTGVLSQERELAKLIRRKYKNKSVVLISNKADHENLRLRIYDPEWKSLGFGEPLPVSAANGGNVGDFLDLVYKQFGKKGVKKAKESLKFEPVKVALIGKPNVGKSTLFNKLIGEERVIVSNLPHTTREPHDTLVEVEGQHYLFVDTAGIRRKTKVKGELERYGIGKSIEAMKRADIVLLLLDTSEPISDQDQQLAGLLREHTKSVIIIINKWDLAEDNDDAFRNEVEARIYQSFPHLRYAPIVFISAKSGYRVHQIFPLLVRAWKERCIEIPDGELKEFLKSVKRKRLPTRGKGVRHPDILALRQINNGPPMFEIFIKQKTSLHSSYISYLTNRLREKYSFFANPIIIKMTKLRRPL
ncbi:MAG TPA: ribosome biogenesis GTPase Der [Patescibacteria group bacterium]|nr:ribosome biogenesis GTPase Der [Patescibacteria group bacterium]